MSVDPGLSGTGWALWQGKKLIGSGSLSARKGSWEERAQSIVMSIVGLAGGAMVTRSYIEQPFIALTGKALISARSGDVVKLSILNGMLVSSLPNCKQVRVIDWKGNMPKKIFNKRIKRFLDSLSYQPTTNTTHELDAIGIGRHILMTTGATL